MIEISMKIRIKKKGFTLIEMVVVIAILSILAVVLVPKVKTHIDNSKKVAIQAQCREIVIAVEAYNAETNLSDQISVDYKENLIASKDEIPGISKFTLEDILKKSKIRNILGDNSTVIDAANKEKVVTDKLINKFDKIPLKTTYDQISRVAQGATFIINKKGQLWQVQGDNAMEVITRNSKLKLNLGEVL